MSSICEAQKTALKNKRGWPSCFKLGASHKKLRADIESENRVSF